MTDASNLIKVFVPCLMHHVANAYLQDQITVSNLKALLFPHPSTWCDLDNEELSLLVFFPLLSFLI